MRTHASKQELVILLAFLICQPTSYLFAQNATQSNKGAIARYSIPKDKEASLSRNEVIRLLGQKIKYVFVLYQENRSFDSYFGTYPGADGLFSHSQANTPGFNQKIVNIDGSVSTIHPFRIGPEEHSCGTVSQCFAADTDDMDHSHPRMVTKMDIQNGVAQMDQFAVTEELKYSPTGNPSLLAKQMGELSMAYEDCDTGGGPQSQDHFSSAIS